MLGRALLPVAAAIVVVLALVIALDPLGVRSDASQYRDYDHPAICVEVGGEAAEDITLTDVEVVAKVREALPAPEDVGYAGWVSPGQAIDVDYGCPGGVRLVCPQVQISSSPREGVLSVSGGYSPLNCHPTLVDKPSKYGLFLFVVSKRDFDFVTLSWDGSFYERYANVESTCTGDMCVGYTNSYYVTVDEFLDTSTLTEILAKPLRVGENTSSGGTPTEWPTVTPEITPCTRLYPDDCRRYPPFTSHPLQ